MLNQYLLYGALKICNMETGQITSARSTQGLSTLLQEILANPRLNPVEKEECRERIEGSTMTTWEACIRSQARTTLGEEITMMRLAMPRNAKPDKEGEANWRRIEMKIMAWLKKSKHAVQTRIKIIWLLYYGPHKTLTMLEEREKHLEETLHTVIQPPLGPLAGGGAGGGGWGGCRAPLHLDQPVGTITRGQWPHTPPDLPWAPCGYAPCRGTDPREGILARLGSPSSEVMVWTMSTLLECTTCCAKRVTPEGLGWAKTPHLPTTYPGGGKGEPWTGTLDPVRRSAAFPLPLSSLPLLTLASGFPSPPPWSLRWSLLGLVRTPTARGPAPPPPYHII